MKELKYLLAYIIPASTVVALYFKGSYSYATLVVAFGIIPLLELVIPSNAQNIAEEDEPALLSVLFYDLLLYAMVPIQYGILGYFMFILVSSDLALYEVIGLVISVGIQNGAVGINVAHELGHRTTKFEQFLSKTLLLTSLYMHFFIEHNRGHHKYVSTPKDPATARLNETVYRFWFRSIIGSFLSAWHIEKTELAKHNKSIWSLNNQMLQFIFLQLGLTILAFLFAGNSGVICFVSSAFIGILLLETVNYVEHYGLLRKEIAPGKYERVQPQHSWNSDQVLGRLVLFELTRHSDHHYKASRKYQILRHMSQSPQLPAGYPGSMLLALVPPLWFRTVNGLVHDLRRLN
jgi:alkane 1-monooxygenase